MLQTFRPIDEEQLFGVQQPATRKISSGRSRSGKESEHPGNDLSPWNIQFADVCTILCYDRKQKINARDLLFFQRCAKPLREPSQCEESRAIVRQETKWKLLESLKIERYPLDPCYTMILGRDIPMIGTRLLDTRLESVPFLSGKVQFPP